MAELSQRLREITDALPLRPGLRVLEIGCGPGAMAREIATRVGPAGTVLAIDRSAKAIAQAVAANAHPNVHFRQTAVEDLKLQTGEDGYDLAVAVRVGALDGRHPESQEAALRAIVAALKPGARLYIDGGKPLRELGLPS